MPFNVFKQAGTKGTIITVVREYVYEVCMTVRDREVKPAVS